MRKKKIREKNTEQHKSKVKIEIYKKIKIKIFYKPWRSQKTEFK